MRGVVVAEAHHVAAAPVVLPEHVVDLGGRPGEQLRSQVQGTGFGLVLLSSFYL